MKGFIEITTSNKGTKYLINVRHIEKVVKSIIFFDLVSSSYNEQEYIECKESYEEIRAKIERATSEKGR